MTAVSRLVTNPQKATRRSLAVLLEIASNAGCVILPSHSASRAVRSRRRAVDDHYLGRGAQREHREANEALDLSPPLGRLDVLLRPATTDELNGPWHRCRSQVQEERRH